MVAPLVGARIEIMLVEKTIKPSEVAPLVGARIEIRLRKSMQHCLASLPSWERGLKSVNRERNPTGKGRSPRGSED